MAINRDPLLMLLHEIDSHDGLPLDDVNRVPEFRAALDEAQDKGLACIAYDIDGRLMCFVLEDGYVALSDAICACGDHGATYRGDADGFMCDDCHTLWEEEK